MTKEDLIKEMKELKKECMKELIEINAKHDTLIDTIAKLSHLIDEAEKE